MIYNVCLLLISLFDNLHDDAVVAFQINPKDVQVEYPLLFVVVVVAALYS